jgi:hypothetical protein|tara:strand:- start:904 stop:1047 length:144 start_codon:yes stop_codon:yes gene_type:complete
MVIDKEMTKIVKMFLPNALFGKEGLRVVVMSYSTLQDEFWLVSKSFC